MLEYLCDNLKGLPWTAFPSKTSSLTPTFIPILLLPPSLGLSSKKKKLKKVPKSQKTSFFYSPVAKKGRSTTPKDFKHAVIMSHYEDLKPLIWNCLDLLQFAYQADIGMDYTFNYLLHKAATHLEELQSTVRIVFFDFSVWLGISLWSRSIRTSWPGLQTTLLTGCSKSYYKAACQTWWQATLTYPKEQYCHVFVHPLHVWLLLRLDCATYRSSRMTPPMPAVSQMRRRRRGSPSQELYPLLAELKQLKSTFSHSWQGINLVVNLISKISRINKLF